MRDCIAPDAASLAAKRRTNEQAKQLISVANKLCDNQLPLADLVGPTMDFWRLTVAASHNIAYQLAYNSLMVTEMGDVSVMRQTIEAELRAGELYLDLAKAIHRRHYKKAIELQHSARKARLRWNQRSNRPLPKDAISSAKQERPHEYDATLYRVYHLNRQLGEVKAKLGNAWTTMSNTFNRTERRRRLEFLLEQGHIHEIPTEWQIMQASRDMLVDYIIPSNGEFYEHYDQNQYWLQFLRVLDEPSAMMDPTGLAVSREMIVQHLLHVVHCTAGYDVGLLHMFPDGIEALEEQLKLYVAENTRGRPRSRSLLSANRIRKELLDALQLYKADPEKYWQLYTFETPEGCDETLRLWRGAIWNNWPLT